jgi:hypothetical protein
MKRIIRKGTNLNGNRVKEYVILINSVILIKRLILIPVISAEQYGKDHYIILKIWGKNCLMYKSFSIKVSSIKEILNKL